MTRIKRLYDKDQEVIIYNPIIEPLQIFLLYWLESVNLEIGNKSIREFVKKQQLTVCQDQHLTACQDQHLTACQDQHMTVCQGQHLKVCQGQHLTATGLSTALLADFTRVGRVGA